MSKLRASAVALRRSRRWLIPCFVAVLTIHAMTTTGILLLAFTLTMSRFDNGADATLLEQGANIVLAVLSFPLLTLLHRLAGSAHWFPGLLGYVPIVLNSAIWAAGICYLVRRLVSRPRMTTNRG